MGTPPPCTYVLWPRSTKHLDRRLYDWNYVISFKTCVSREPYEWPSISAAHGWIYSVDNTHTFIHIIACLHTRCTLTHPAARRRIRTVRNNRAEVLINTLRNLTRKYLNLKRTSGSILIVSFMFLKGPVFRRYTFLRRIIRKLKIC